MAAVVVAVVLVVGCMRGPGGAVVVVAGAGTARQTGGQARQRCAEHPQVGGRRQIALLTRDFLAPTGPWSSACAGRYGTIISVSETTVPPDTV